MKLITVAESQATFAELSAEEQAQWNTHVFFGEVVNDGTPCRELTWSLDAPGGQVYGYADNSLDINLAGEIGVAP